MADIKGTRMSRKKYDETQRELERLTTVVRQEIQDKIAEARAQGDLSENAEYDAAKDAQGKNEDDIVRLTELLKHAIIVEGVTVTVTNHSEGGRRIIYTIVGPTETDPENGYISNECPIGRAIESMKVGERRAVTVPGGFVDIEVVEKAVG